MRDLIEILVLGTALLVVGCKASHDAPTLSQYVTPVPGITAGSGNGIASQSPAPSPARP